MGTHAVTPALIRLFKLLKQIEGSAGSADGFALFSGQVGELESVAVPGAIAHDALYANWSRSNRNRKLQVDGSTDVPAGNKYPSDSSFVDIQ